MKGRNLKKAVGASLAAAAFAITAGLVPHAALAADLVPMYRLYNQWSGEHLFTTNADE